MPITDFQAKLIAVIRAENDTDEDIAVFWSAFTRHHGVLAATPDNQGIVTLSISDDIAGELVERTLYYWADIEADFLDVDSTTWRDLAHNYQLRRNVERAQADGYTPPW